MRRTRECGDEYLPALVALRVRMDYPEGVAARFEAEGEEAMMAIAREEFERDWSEEGIARHCGDLLALPAERRDAVVARERTCLPSADCTAFTVCNMDLLERRWSGADADR